MQKSRLSLYRLVFTGLFAALIFVGTFFFKIPTIGYIHLGDGFIFIAASILPLPYAMAAAALGGGLADLLGGYAIWIPGTMIIKALCVVLFNNKAKKALCWRNILAVLFAAVVNIAGYYLYGSLIQGNFITCLTEIPMNAAQETAGAIIFIVMALLLNVNPALHSFIMRKINGSNNESSDKM